MTHWFGHHWRDIVDVASAVGTVGAAVLAWLAIKAASRQAQRSADALIRERRLSHELDLLTDLDEAVQNRAAGNWGFHARRLLRLLPEKELQRARVLYGLPVQAETQAELTAAQAPGRANRGTNRADLVLPGTQATTYMDAVQAEIQAAIAARLARRW